MRLRVNVNESVRMDEGNSAKRVNVAQKENG